MLKVSVLAARGSLLPCVWMERIVLTLGDLEIEAARDPQRGLLVLWEAKLLSAGATLAAPPPSPSPSQPQPVPRSALPSAAKPQPATGFPSSEPVPCHQPQQQ